MTWYDHEYLIREATVNHDSIGNKITKIAAITVPPAVFGDLLYDTSQHHIPITGPYTRNSEAIFRVFPVARGTEEFQLVEA